MANVKKSNMKFEIVEEKGNKLSIEYDKIFEDTLCTIMGWDKLTEFRLQYFINEAMYNFIQKQGKTKPGRKK